MALPIYVFADGAAAQEVLNAVATFLSLNDYSTAVAIAATVAVLLAGIRFIATHDLRAFFLWLFAYLIITGVMLMPYDGDVQIIDASNPMADYSVGNLPLGIVVPGTIITTITYDLLQDFDEIYSVPGELDYSQTGMMFGSRLFRASMQANLTSSDDQEFVRNFFENCIEQDVALGKYKMSDITENPNIMASLTGTGGTSLTMSPLRGVYYQNNFETCAAAVGTLNNIINAAALEQEGNIGAMLNIPAVNVVGNINDIYAYYFNNESVESQNNLQQNILINSFRDAANSVATADNATAGAINYAYTNTEENNSITGLTMANMAADLIPMMQTIFTLMLMGFFPIIMLIAIQPTLFVQVMKNYIYAYIYLGSWPFLFDFLNFLMNYFVSENTGGFVVGSSSSGYMGATMSTANALFNLNTQAAAYCGYLMMAIPFLPPLLVKGMSSGISMLGNHFAGSMQSSATSYASQVQAGDFTMGTTSFGNQSFNNVSGNKWDTNTLMAEGSTTFQTPFGGLVTKTASGNMVYNSSGAQDVLPVSIDMQKSLSSSLSNNIGETTQSITDTSTALQKSSSLAANQMVQLGRTAGSMSTTGSGASITGSSELSQSYNQALDIAEQYKSDHNLAVSNVEMLQSIVQGGVQANADIAGGSTPFSASASVNAGMSGSSISEHHVNSSANAYNDLSSNQRQGIDNFIRMSKQYAATEHTDLSNSEGMQLTRDLQASLGSVEQESSTLSASMQKLQSYHQEQQMVSSSQFSNNEAPIYNSMFASYMMKENPRAAEVLLNNPNLSENQREDLQAYVDAFSAQVIGSGALGGVKNDAAGIGQNYAENANAIVQDANNMNAGFGTEGGAIASGFKAGNIPDSGAISSGVNEGFGNAQNQINEGGSSIGNTSEGIAGEVNSRFATGDKVAKEGAVTGAAKAVAENTLALANDLTGSSAINTAKNKMADSEIEVTNPDGSST